MQESFNKGTAVHKEIRYASLRCTLTAKDGVSNVEKAGSLSPANQVAAVPTPSRCLCHPTPKSDGKL